MSSESDPDLVTAKKQFEPENTERVVTIYDTGIARFNQPAQNHLDTEHVKIDVESGGDEVRFEPVEGNDDDHYSIAKDSGAVSMAGPLDLMGKAKPDGPVSATLQELEDDPDTLRGYLDELPEAETGESS